MKEADVASQLQDVLGRPVGKIKLEDLPGDASIRRYFRIHLADGNTFVLMELPPEMQPDLKNILSVWDYFWKHNLGVPERYGYAAQSGIIFSEDLGDLTLEQLVEGSSGEEYRPYYKQAVDLICRMQQVGNIHPEPGCPAFNLVFDTEKFAWELDFFRRYFLEEFRGQKITKQDKVELHTYFHRLSERLSQESRYLAHRDYHSRNLLIKSGSVRVVDFQDARQGPPTYDLASLLRDSYVSLPQALIEELLEYYLEQNAALVLGGEDRQKFLRLFDYTCLQRNLKALGTFGYQASVRHNLRYAADVPRTIGYVAHNLGKYQELGGLRALLRRYLPELT